MLVGGKASLFLPTKIGEERASVRFGFSYHSGYLIIDPVEQEEQEHY